MIDAYTHCSETKYEPAESVLATMRASGVSRAVLVQHLGGYDNSYLEKVVDIYRGRFTAVGLVDSESFDWAERVTAVASSQAFSGLRLTTEMMVSNPDLGFTAAAAGLVPILYTPGGVASAISTIVELAGAIPEQAVVVTHLGCPRVDEGRVVAGWDLLDLSELPNVMVTLSGQTMFTPYPHHPLDEFVRRVIDEFTADRILWGSNYPVVGDSSDYARDLGLVLAGNWSLAPSQIHRITESNAAEVFFREVESDRKE